VCSLVVLVRLCSAEKGKGESSKCPPENQNRAAEVGLKPSGVGKSKFKWFTLTEKRAGSKL